MKKSLVLLLTLIALVGPIMACGQAAKPSPVSTPTTGPTPTPLPLQAPGLEGVTVRTLCLEVEQSFPEITDPEYEELTPHISETTQLILSGLGLQVVEGACDAILAITMIGKAIGATYLKAGFCYEGAEVNGEIHLTLSGRPPLSVPISGSFKPRSMIPSEHCSKEPFTAPFSLAWPNALLRGLAQLWGPRVFIAAMWDDERGVGSAAIELLGRIGPVEEAVPALIQVLESHKSSFVREDAVFALGQIGPDVAEIIPALAEALEDKSSLVRAAAAEALGQLGPRAVEAVPALIQTLRNPGFSGRKASAEALSAITGQDFGEDARTWQAWWDEQQ